MKFTHSVFILGFIMTTYKAQAQNHPVETPQPNTQSQAQSQLQSQTPHNPTIVEQTLLTKPLPSTSSQRARVTQVLDKYRARRSNPFQKREYAQNISYWASNAIMSATQTTHFNPIQYKFEPLIKVEPLIDESHIEAIAHRSFNSVTAKDLNSTGEWQLINTIIIERNELDFATKVTETYRYTDSETGEVEDEIWTYEAEYLSNGLLKSISLSTNYLGLEILFGVIRFTYDSVPSKVLNLVEILISDVDENLNFTYDTVSTNILYVGETATYQSIGSELDTTIVTATEGDSLIVNAYESYLEEDWFTGELTRVIERTRETYADLGSLTELWNLMSLVFWEEHTVQLREMYDEELEEFIPEERVIYSSVQDTVTFTHQWWDGFEENWVDESKLDLTFDENIQLEKREEVRTFGEEVEYYEDLINPAAEFLQFVSVEEEQQIPSSIRLHQNYPNPFNPSTQITFDLQSGGYVQLTVLDIMGREIATLLNQRLNAGSHQVKFLSSGLSSGVYLYRLDVSESGNARVSETRMMTLIK